LRLSGELDSLIVEAIRQSLHRFKVYGNEELANHAGKANA
jgi:hypothetical protein